MSETSSSGGIPAIREKKCGLVYALLRQEFDGETVTEGKLAEKLSEYSHMFGLSERERDHVNQKFRVKVFVKQETGEVIEDDIEFEDWYFGEAKKDRFATKLYQDYLNDGKHGLNFPSHVIGAIQKDTDKIVSKLGNPRMDGPWDRRGMVVGNVQSGKTANYLSVICKAADAGYRMIIVIAGIHNNLRSQTQKRIDEGYLGFNTHPESKSEDVGIGITGGKTYSDEYKKRGRPIPFTDRKDDFNKVSKQKHKADLTAVKSTIIAVIKKNPNVLKALNQWVEEKRRREFLGKRIPLPMLLIDDEADNASVNTQKDPTKVSRINGQIRELLSQFERSTYLGYTATPFANIFIDPEADTESLGADLFPRDFIYALKPPTNYCGAVKWFGETSADGSAELVGQITTISDHMDILPVKHKIDHVLLNLPVSMVEAMRCFIIGRAIRILRGDGNQHMAMLVNASRFSDMQTTISSLINARKNLDESLLTYGDMTSGSGIFEEYRKVWAGSFSQVNDFEWEEVAPVLIDSIVDVDVLTINGKSNDSFEYEDYDKDGRGRHIIAVGGLSLSRGITLEGLMVSYMLRNTRMYDTLLQMGRWFGYRPGYEDLCRLFLTADSEGWYQFITRATEEVIGEFEEMKRQKKTPKEFGLRVRRSPDGLLITARNKMRKGEKVRVSVALKGKLVETSVLSFEELTVEKNWAAGKALVEKAIQTGSTYGSDIYTGTSAVRMWGNIPVEAIEAFISQFSNHEHSRATDSALILGFLEKRKDAELAVWDVAVTGSPRNPVADDNKLGIEYRHFSRTLGGFTSLDEKVAYVGNKNRVGSAKMEAFGLSEMRVKKVTKESEKTIPGLIWRKQRDRPLLLLHPIEFEWHENSPHGGTPPPSPLLGYSISFPNRGLDGETVEYLFNVVRGSTDEFDEEGDEYEDE